MYNHENNGGELKVYIAAMQKKRTEKQNVSKVIYIGVIMDIDEYLAMKASEK